LDGTELLIYTAAMPAGGGGGGELEKVKDWQYEESLAYNMTSLWVDSSVTIMFLHL